MKRLLAVLVVLMMLCSCSNSRSVEKINPESQSTPQVSGESEPEPSSGFSEESNFENSNEAPDTEEIPVGYQEADFGEFSVLVCDHSFSGCAPMEVVTKENNRFVGDDGETKRVIAELLSVEDVTDKDDPFAFYDEKYSSSVNTVELLFHDFPAKKYHIQTQNDEVIPIKTNNIYYCVCLNGQIATFAYYPVMGQGGLHTEDIEAVLDTIRLK